MGSMRTWDEVARTVKLDPVLLASMRMPAWRQEARKRGVAAYFPPDEQATYAIAGQSDPRLSGPTSRKQFLGMLR